jgi:hypothetical protein
MAEATMETAMASDAEATTRSDPKVDRARMKRIGSQHFVLVMGALTLWGAAETWARTTGWTIAEVAAVANALIAATVIASTIHEWGHFAGARLSGAISPVLRDPRRHFFMFDFDLERNDVRQFLWMSWGGILAPWIPVAIVLVGVPLDRWSDAALLAAFVWRASAVAAFEVPVVRTVARDRDPIAALRERVKAGGLASSGRVGMAIGAVCFVLLVLAG